MSVSTSIKYLGFDDRWLICLGVPVVSLLVSLMTFGDAFTELPLACFLVGMAFTVCYWILIRKVIIEYHKRFDDYRFTVRRLGFVIFWVGLSIILVKVSITQIIHNCFPHIAELAHKNMISELLTTLIIIAMMFFLYEGIYYFNKSRLTEIEKNKLERITAEQKLSTLKNQVNPHFLFNSLNTLVSIIPEEPNLAINFVQKLSKTYRNILEVRDEKLITIEKELEALDSYIYLLKTRFQGKIQILNTLDESIMHHFVLPLSLQILIENAVKHNITSKNKPLKVSLSNDNDYVTVRNNLQRKQQQYNSTKLGLANIKSRYELLTNQEIIVEETAEEFVVKLPIIKQAS